LICGTRAVIPPIISGKLGIGNVVANKSSLHHTSVLCKARKDSRDMCCAYTGIAQVSWPLTSIYCVNYLKKWWYIFFTL